MKRGEKESSICVCILAVEIKSLESENCAYFHSS